MDANIYDVSNMYQIPLPMTAHPHCDTGDTAKRGKNPKCAGYKKPRSAMEI